MKIEIYTKDGCPFCTKAKEWLDSRGFVYETYDVTDDELRKSLYAAHNINTVPAIFIDGELIGGYTQLEEKGINWFIQTKGIMDTSLAYKPFLYPGFVETARVHEKIHWVEDEIDLSEDVHDWKGGKLTSFEKDFIQKVLTLFTQSDVAVADNYIDQLLPRFKNNQVRHMLLSFAAREPIHQRAYALLNETLGFPDSFYGEFLSYKEMAQKLDHMQESNINSHRGLALALAKSVFNEGVMLFASFAMLLNFTRFNKMKGMGKVVDWSIRDEDMHAKGIASLFRVFCEEKSRIVNDEFKREIYDMARRTVELEDAFIDLAFEHNEKAIQGLTADDVKTYIRYITDRRLVSLGLKENYGIEHNPLDWIDWIVGGTRHSNFFEQRPSTYAVGGMTGSFSYDFIT